MATVVAPPVQVSADPQFRRPGGQNFSGVNPFYFKVGDQLYQFLAAAQTEAKVGMFKRAAASLGGAWAEKDALNSPDQGNQSGSAQAFYNPVTGIIAVMYLLADNSGIRICEFNTGAVSGTPDTWGAPTATLLYAVGGTTFVFVQRSDLTYVVLGTNNVNHAFRATYAAGAWSGLTVLIASGVELMGGVIDPTDTIHFLINETAFALDYRQLSSTYVLGAPTTIQSSIGLGQEDLPTISLWGPDSVAIGSVANTGAAGVYVSIGTPLAAPAFTKYPIYVTVDSEVQNFATIAVGIGGDLNVFFVNQDNNPMEGLLDQILRSTFNGTNAWSVPSVFYDAIQNPPAHNVPDPAVNQFIHTGQYIELAQGWSGATCMETQDQIDPEQFWCTGFALDPKACPVWR